LRLLACELFCFVRLAESWKERTKQTYVKDLVDSSFTIASYFESLSFKVVALLVPIRESVVNSAVEVIVSEAISPKCDIDEEEGNVTALSGIYGKSCNEPDPSRRYPLLLGETRL
jgi:hypothetical protein